MRMSQSPSEMVKPRNAPLTGCGATRGRSKNAPARPPRRAADDKRVALRADVETEVGVEPLHDLHDRIAFRRYRLLRIRSLSTERMFTTLRFEKSCRLASARSGRG